MRKLLIAVLVGGVIGGLGVAVWYVRHTSMPVLQPQGTIGRSEQHLIFIALALSLLVVIPVFVMLFVFAWKYRATNTRATYSPNLDHNHLAETVWWLLPSLLILVLSVITWRSSHQLDPYQPLASSEKPMTIRVVALNWKWLFLYPEQHIASVNFVQFPIDTPVTFEITSDTVMNSFWIPNLGGQMYAMPGMSTQLHLSADQVGDYRGSSANISGQGFASMHFTARASSEMAFNQWVAATKHSPLTLTTDTYAALAKPSQNTPTTRYASYDPELYDDIMMQYMMPGMKGMKM